MTEPKHPVRHSNWADQSPFLVPSLDGLLTVGVAAKRCGVSDYYIKSWIESGRLAAFCPYGPATMFAVHPKDLQRFCKQHGLDYQAT